MYCRSLQFALKAYLWRYRNRLYPRNPLELFLPPGNLAPYTPWNPLEPLHLIPSKSLKSVTLAGFEPCVINLRVKTISRKYNYPLVASFNPSFISFHPSIHPSIYLSVYLSYLCISINIFNIN